ncbi:MAG: serine O-acetyltransferase [Coriobacteriia bacterium]
MGAVERLHAVSSRLHAAGLRPLARLIQGFLRVAFGVSLPATAVVGADTSFANHGLGTVIHPRAVIGANCVIGSCVSVGCRSKHPDVPVIEDDCFIGTGARVLGPVRVGAGSVIGANAVVLEDVPPGSMAAGVPATVVRNGIHARDFADLPRELAAVEAGRE